MRGRKKLALNTSYGRQEGLAQKEVLGLRPRAEILLLTAGPARLVVRLRRITTGPARALAARRSALRFTRLVDFGIVRRQRTGHKPMPKFTTGFTRLGSPAHKLCAGSRSGFTLAELIMSVLIIGIILSAVAFGYRDFNDRLENTNMAFEIALFLREAQVSGTSVRQTPLGGSFTHAWGVHTKIDGSNSSNLRIILFADLDDDGTYDGNFTTCPSGECISFLDMRRQNIINKIYRLTTTGNPTCPPDAAISGVSITFLRPKPDARLFFMNTAGQQMCGGETDTLGVLICLQSPLLKRKAVEVLETGEISVKNAPIECT
ncbi:MAG: hypothetical protein G01um1014107_61 [Parcubacteria group bacterium Gr01-1014_107]|nr:MAG: hypothetical protein G01um1014107_61 [Parcubacteria group bacterium Gr01-1014_107]